MARIKGPNTPSIREIREHYALDEEKLLEEFKVKGFPIPHRPKDSVTRKPFEPTLPEDLTKLSPQELGRMNTLFTAYADWVNFEAARADVRLENAESILIAIKAQLRFTKTGTDVDRADQARIDTQYLEADSTAQKAKYWKGLVEAIVSKLNKDLRVISREITRRMDQSDLGGTHGAMQAARGIKKAGSRHSRFTYEN